MMKKRKTVIIGAGHVGAHVANALMMQNICEEIVLLDTDEKKAKSNAEDLQDVACYAGCKTRIWDGGYEELDDADICVISYCGFIFEENRLEELGDALRIADEIIPQIQKTQFAGTIVSITNPCDLVALYFRLKTDYPVIGTGTALDSARFRVRLSQALHMESASVEAFCVGEHGNSQVPVWSQARIGGRLLTELCDERPEQFGTLNREEIERSTISAGWRIVTGKGSTEYGIGAAAARVIRALLTKSGEVLPCSYEYRRTPDSPLIYTSIPSVIGHENGVLQIEPQLSEGERERFEESCLLMERYRAEYLDSRL